MNIFRLDIPNKDGIDTSRFVSQVYDYISLWNGHPGLEEIGNNLTYDEMCREIGHFVIDMDRMKAWKDTSRIRGILVYDNDMGDFKEGFIFRGGILKYID